jgi:hypothetical protein
MEALIKQVMKGMPLVGDSIEKGYYDVRGPDGKCIIPQYWNASVRPATKVTLKTFLLNSDYIALMSYKENYKRRAIDE